ncbi:MAG: DUF4148 domain-containing protein [Rubrivivax sp.]|nr:MAG: DUF4148 domain-containing protein [Rubrivivax sp.]
MKTSRTFALAFFTAATTLAGAAHADVGLSRAQVKAELAQAQRSGDLIDYETGRKLNELFPGAYAAQPVNADNAAALNDLPPTAAGGATVLQRSGPAAKTLRPDTPSGAPWDYEAISERNAQALAHGHSAL